MSGTVVYLSARLRQLLHVRFTVASSTILPHALSVVRGRDLLLRGYNNLLLKTVNFYCNSYYLETKVL